MHVWTREAKRTQGMVQAVWRRGFLETELLRYEQSRLPSVVTCVKPHA